MSEKTQNMTIETDKQTVRIYSKLGLETGILELLEDACYYQNNWKQLQTQASARKPEHIS